MDYSYTINGRILALNDISLSFGENLVLKGVSGAVHNIVRPNMEQGQVVALLGPSGIGKTQLFRIMASLEIPGGTVTGSVTLGVNDIPIKPGLIGVVQQSYPLFRNRTVLGNLLVAGGTTELSPTDVLEKARGLLQEFELTNRADLYPSQLSGGQRQRLAIAQQLMCSEHLILMDEPFSGLDPLMVDRVVGFIQKIAVMNEYNTTIVVTHDISTALVVADRIWVLGRDRDDKGEIIPGAHIVDDYDLAEMGLAWRPDIRKDPLFRELSGTIRDRFKTL